MPTPIPHFLLPQGLFIFRALQRRNFHTARRVLDEKHRILEKPAKFNPPSHGARIPTSRRPQRTYGAPLSEVQKEEQAHKQYPRMMPPQGSFMHWFLTNRTIHLWITLGTLSLLALTVSLENYHRTSPVAHLLPSGSDFFSHPLDFLSQYLSVYKLHVEARSAETAERRRKKTEDLQKRDRFRKAHGIEDTQNVWGFGRRLEKIKEGGEGEGSPIAVEGVEGDVEREKLRRVEGAGNGEGRANGEYVDFEGRKKPLKKWLGICAASSVELRPPYPYFFRDFRLRSRTPHDFSNIVPESYFYLRAPLPTSPNLPSHTSCHILPAYSQPSMPAPTSFSQLSPSELSYLQTSLALHPPIRPDARAPTTFRPLLAETDLLPSCNGSARLCFADVTEAIVGVKGEVERTPQVIVGEGGWGGLEEDVKMAGEGQKEEGENNGGKADWVEVTVDIPGQRDDDAVVVFLGAMIREAVVGDGGLQRRLWINGRWHWRLYVDILLLSPPQSYPLPLLSIATHLALLSTRLPAPISAHDEDPLFNDDWDAALPLYAEKGAKPPITLLVMAVGGNVFFDPSTSELAVADCVLAVSVTREEEEGGMRVVAIRTVETSARGVVGVGMDGGGKEGAEGEGVWVPPRGGMKRGVVRRMVQMVTEEGGVGEEVLRGLEGLDEG